MLRFLENPLLSVHLEQSVKKDSSELRLIHDCSMPRGLGVNSYIDIEKQSFQTIDDAVSLLKKGYYMAKVDLRHAYQSIRFEMEIW